MHVLREGGVACTEFWLQTAQITDVTTVYINIATFSEYSSARYSTGDEILAKIYAGI